MGSGLTLHLGVVVTAYRSSGKKVQALTTGDVAQILEDKYGVMGAYFKAHGNDIAKAMESGLQGALESKLMGDPKGSTLDAAMQPVMSGFRDFITSREAESVGMPGVPTQAAINGVNHRLKHPYRKSNPQRPSFFDSHLYVNSFFAWVSKT